MKFQDLKQGNQFEVGTKIEERLKVMEAIKEKGKESLLISINNIEFKIFAFWSLSRKSVHWLGNLTSEQYIGIGGNPKWIKKDIEKYTPFFYMTGDGRCTIHSGGNKMNIRIDNSKIQIL